MLPVYKYALIKYLKSRSTWIILAVSIFIASFLGGYLPFNFIDTSKASAATEYGIVSVALIGGITSTLGIFVSVFSGFKAATLFRDEVEDGTFLVFLSKPQTRGQIIFGKWLALITLLFAYTFLTILAFAVMISIFDNGSQIASLASLGLKTLRSQIAQISLVIWGLLFVFALIFSSIALLLSTKITVGGTIGISIALGVIIPVTGLVGTFTKFSPYALATSSNIDTFTSSVSNFSKSVTDPSEKAIIDQIIDQIKQNFAPIVESQESLYNLGINTHRRDTFKFAWVFDLNFQISQLATIASNMAIPNDLIPILANTSSNSGIIDDVTTIRAKNDILGDLSVNQMPTVIEKMVVDDWTIVHNQGQQLEVIVSQIVNNMPDGPLKREAEDFLEVVKSMVSDPLVFLLDEKNLIGQINDNNIPLQKNINYPTTITLSDNDHKIYQELYSIAVYEPGMIVKISTKDYVNTYSILYVYIAIAILLVPVSYLIVKRQDFR